VFCNALSSRLGEQPVQLLVRRHAPGPGWRTRGANGLSCRGLWQVTKICSENWALTLYPEGGAEGRCDGRSARHARPRGRSVRGCRSPRAPSGNGRWHGARTGRAR
jgi:hypothetical protein